MTVDFAAQAAILREEVDGLEQIAVRADAVPTDAARRLAEGIREAIVRAIWPLVAMEVIAESGVELTPEEEARLSASGYELIEATREMRESMKMVQDRIPAFGGSTRIPDPED